MRFIILSPSSPMDVTLEENERAVLIKMYMPLIRVFLEEVKLTVSEAGRRIIERFWRKEQIFLYILALRA